MQIDDAFAGGACRCQRCGTIQTVPKRLKPSSTGTKPTSSKTQSNSTSQSKPLYAKKVRSDTGLSSGLDELAEVVASSGLSSMRDRKKPAALSPKTCPAAPPPTKKSRLPILLGVLALVLLLIGVAIGYLLRHK